MSHLRVGIYGQFVIMKTQAERTAWLRERRAGIGGSDIAAILGVSPWRTAMDVFLDKTGASPLETEETEPMYWGTILEDVVAKEFEKRTGKRVMRVNNIIRHKQHPWAMASLDRAVWMGEKCPVVKGELRTDELLECKTCNAFKAMDWAGDDSDAIPVEYTAQAMWYLGVTGARVCHVAVLIGGQQFAMREIVRDEEIISLMLKRAEEFWTNNVLRNLPPEKRQPGDTAKLFDKNNESSVEAGSEAVMAFNRLREVKSAIVPLEDEKARLEETIKAHIGEAAVMTVDGNPIVSWRAAKDGKKTNWAKVADEIKGWVMEQEIEDGVSTIRAIIDENTETKPGSRRFIIKGE